MIAKCTAHSMQDFDETLAEQCATVWSLHDDFKSLRVVQKLVQCQRPLSARDLWTVRRRFIIAHAALRDRAAEASIGSTVGGIGDHLDALQRILAVAPIDRQIEARSNTECDAVLLRCDMRTNHPSHRATIGETNRS